MNRSRNKRGRNKRGIILAAAAVLAAAVFTAVFYGDAFARKLRQVFAPASAFDTSADFVKVIDVGQADCLLVYSNGRSLLIDAGLPASAEDICLELDSYGINSIDAVIITHLHDDHAGGLEELSKRHGIDNLIIPELSSGGEAATGAGAAERTVAENGGRIYTAVQGMNLEIGEFEITVLAYYGDMSDQNDRSVIVMAEIGGLKFLFTGDAGDKTEKKLIDEGINIDCDVLKVGHHGSGGSSSDVFLTAASPEYAAISVGENNIYSHPSTEVTSALEAAGAEIYRTDTDGDITFFVENGKISPQTEY